MSRSVEFNVGSWKGTTTSSRKKRKGYIANTRARNEETGEYLDVRITKMPKRSDAKKAAVKVAKQIINNK